MRLIDAEALENEIAKTMRYVPKDAVLDVACMVNRAPTIEAKPVVHAHWVTDFDFDPEEEQELYFYFCSKCKKELFGYKEDFKYCPYCGAQMDEVTK